MECIGPSSLLRAESSATVLMGDLEHEYRRCQINTFGGGINELQRGICRQLWPWHAASPLTTQAIIMDFSICRPARDPRAGTRYLPIARPTNLCWLSIAGTMSMTTPCGPHSPSRVCWALLCPKDSAVPAWVLPSCAWCLRSRDVASPHTSLQPGFGRAAHRRVWQ